MTDTLTRFEDKYVVCPGTACWIWTAGISSNGYAVFWDRGPKKAHRFAYERFVGPVPAGLELDHLCRVRHCVNPEHLEPVTRAENCKRGNLNKHHTAKTHCPHGHPYDDANTYITPEGWRACRACKERYR